MARPLRIQYEGALYHVTCRGNEHKAIYKDDQDRKVFLELLNSGIETYNIIIYCYVLMENHVLCEASHNYLVHITFPPASGNSSW